MKKGLLLIAFGLSSIGLLGQEQLYNGDFEDWAGSGANEPANWHSFLTANCTIGGIIGFFACPIATGSDQLDQVASYDGSNCVEIQCVNLSGADANGNLTTGRIHIGSDDPLSADNYNYTERAGGDHDAAFTSSPDSVIFWYKALFITPGNTAKATFTIHSDADYFDPGGPANQVVGVAVDDQLTSTTWTRHAIAYTYTGNGATASYILATLTTNPLGGAGDAGDRLWVDNIKMIYNMTPSYSFTSQCVGNTFNLSYTCNASIVDSNKTFYAELSDASGSFASPTVIGSTTRNVGQVGSGTISCTIPSVPNGAGYKIRVRHVTEELAENPGSAFSISTPATAGTATPTASTSCSTPNGQVAVSGGSGATSYELFDSGNNSQGSNGTGTFTGLTPGDYYVTYISACGNDNTATVTVNAPATPTAGTATPTASTSCTTPNGGIAISGGSGATSYELFDSGNNSQGSNGSGTFSGLAPGDYYVNYINDCGSDATATVTVNAPANPTAGTLSGSDVSDCLNPNGSVSLSGSSGTSFELFIAGGATTGQTNASGNFTGLNAGDYEVVATDGNGCTATTNSVTVGNASAPAAPTAGTDATYCEGDVMTDLTATAGAGGTLQWYLGGNPESTGTTQTPSSAVGTHVYTVTETVSNCESSPTTVTIVVNPDAVAGTGTPTASTSCTSPDGQIVISGATGDNFELFTAGGTSVSSNATGSFAGLAAGDYYVEVSNGCGSDQTATITVTGPAGPTAGTITPTDITDCANPNGEVNVTGSNGTSFELFDSGDNSQGSNATGAFTGLVAGDYYVVITDGIGCTTTTSNVTVGNNTGHTVSIAPAATQNINTNTDGTQIDATESSTATSREWMYTTTSGSGYMSFTPAETMASYTPNFTAAGTYYVVCESVISGCTVMSSEVEIVVTSAVGIEENEMNLVNVYAFEKQMFVDLSNVTLNNPIIKLYSAEGKIVLEKRLNNGTMNTFNVNVPLGVYIFNIVTNDNASTGKVVLK